MMAAMLTLATEATMFQRPRLRSALWQMPFAALGATASSSRIGRVERGDTIRAWHTDASTRSSGFPPVGAVELADSGNEAWSAVFSQPPARADEVPPSQRTPSRTTDLRRPDLPPPALPPLAGSSLRVPPFVEELVRNWRDGRRPCMIAGYDDGGALLIDFARHEVRADARAWERLLARGDLPRIADESLPLQGPTYRAERHPIESLVWAVGLASANLPLLGAPAAWRSAPLTGRGWQDFPSLSCAPAHLHLAELASQGETTPQQLRRATRVDERALRAFLQAALFVRLLEWTR